MTEPLLKWTGHPLADVGVATLCAMAKKTSPEQLTLDDLDAAGKTIAAAYTDSIFVAYLSCVYSMNAPYTNPNPKVTAESRTASIKRLTQPHRGETDEGTDGVKCIFSGEPATHLMDRAHMPMLTGAGVMNFFPMGRSELPVAAPYLLAIQALALGGRRSEGKLLIVHCDDPRWTLQFASRFLAANQRIINMANAGKLPEKEGPDESLERECAGYDKQKKKPKYPDVKAPESLVMADLVEIAADSTKGEMARTPTSVTAYLMSNSGQGPSLAIEHIPGSFVQFLKELHGAEYHAKWQQLVFRSWRPAKGQEAEAETEGQAPAKKPKKAAKSKGSSVKPGPGRSRNDLYNDLLEIFHHGYVDWQAATRFVRRHLLSDPTRVYFIDPQKSANQAPRFGREQLTLIDWELTSLFLEKVLGMNQERIALIKEFATQLATVIDEHNDKRLFRELVFTAGEWQYRALLTKVQQQYFRDRGKLLFGFDEYVDIFLTPDGDGPPRWSLIRDLISIRLVEQLHEKKFFERPQNAGAMEEKETEEAA